MQIIELDGEVSGTHCTFLSPQGQVKRYMMYCSGVGGGEGEKGRGEGGVEVKEGERWRGGGGEGGGEVKEGER